MTTEATMREYLDVLRNAHVDESNPNIMQMCMLLGGRYSSLHNAERYNLSNSDLALNPSAIDFYYSYNANEMVGGFEFYAVPAEHFDEPHPVRDYCSGCSRDNVRCCEIRHMTTTAVPHNGHWGCYAGRSRYGMQAVSTDAEYEESLRSARGGYRFYSAHTNEERLAIFLLVKEACGECLNRSTCQARRSCPSEVSVEQIFHAITRLPDGHWSCYLAPMPGLTGERNINRTVPNPDGLPTDCCTCCDTEAPVVDVEARYFAVQMRDVDADYNVRFYDANGDVHTLCHSCASNEVTFCIHCEQPLVIDHSGYNYNSNDDAVCNMCQDEYYHNCVSCGTMLNDDNSYYFDDDEECENPRCYYCHQTAVRESGDFVAGYHSQDKTRTMFGELDRNNNRMRYRLGFELEVENEAYSSEQTDLKALRALFEKNMLYFEHDGSLVHGYEIITAPMTPQYFDDNRRSMVKMLGYLRTKGYRSHQTRTCGLHVHVGKEAFYGKGWDTLTSLERQERYEANLAKLLYIVEKFWGSMLKLTRRTSTSLNQWAARYNVTDHDQLKEYAKSPRYLGRYRAINLSNPHTIEFRLFRGTLRDETLIATVELVNALVDCACEESVDRIKRARKLSALLGKHRMTPTMRAYFTRRGLSA